MNVCARLPFGESSVVQPNNEGQPSNNHLQLRTTVPFVTAHLEIFHCTLCTIYLEPGWELNNYLGKLYCVPILQRNM